MLFAASPEALPAAQQLGTRATSNVGIDGIDKSIQVSCCLRILSFWFVMSEPRHLGCNVTLVVDEFASKLWEATDKLHETGTFGPLKFGSCQEANYEQEAKNAQMFADNFGQDPTVKIPKAGYRCSNSVSDCCIPCYHFAAESLETHHCIPS